MLFTQIRARSIITNFGFRQLFWIELRKKSSTWQVPIWRLMWLMKFIWCKLHIYNLDKQYCKYSGCRHFTSWDLGVAKSEKGWFVHFLEFHSSQGHISNKVPIDPYFQYAGYVANHFSYNISKYEENFNDRIFLS